MLNNNIVNNREIF